MSETGDLLDKSDHEIARLRQQVAELEALKIAHLVGNPLKEIEALRQVNLISQQTIDDKNVQIEELTAKLDKAREALKLSYEKLKLHLSGTREYTGGTPTQTLFPMIEEVLAELDK